MLLVTLRSPIITRADHTRFNSKLEMLRYLRLRSDVLLSLFFLLGTVDKGSQCALIS